MFVCVVAIRLDKQTSGMCIMILTAGTRIFKIQDVKEVDILWRPALTSNQILRVRVLESDRVKEGHLGRS